MNQFLIHNLHIFLRVDVCQADMGQFVDFHCNISCRTEMSASLPVVLGAQCSLLVSVRPHWEHRNASVGSAPACYDLTAAYGRWSSFFTEILL